MWSPLFSLLIWIWTKIMVDTLDQSDCYWTWQRHGWLWWVKPWPANASCWWSVFWHPQCFFCRQAWQSPTSGGCCTRFKKELAITLSCDTWHWKHVHLPVRSGSSKTSKYAYIYMYIYMYKLKILLLCYAQYICSQNLIVLTIGISSVSFDISTNTAILLWYFPWKSVSLNMTKYHLYTAVGEMYGDFAAAAVDGEMYGGSATISGWPEQGSSIGV